MGKIFTNIKRNNYQKDGSESKSEVLFNWKDNWNKAKRQMFKNLSMSPLVKYKTQNTSTSPNKNEQTDREV